MRICPSCEKRPMQKHHNSKWCLRCALERRKRPLGRLTSKQRAFAIRHRADMPFLDICKKLKSSPSNVKRSCRGVRFCFKNGKLRNNPQLIRKVLDYYSANGWHLTVKAFPDVRIKSIIHRAEYYGQTLKPRQIRWKNSEIVLAARMAGLVEGKRQARIFNRPGANEGSIKSLWMKKFGHGGGNIHGMSEWMARRILRPGYPVLKTRMWSPRRGTKAEFQRGLVLWCEMEPFLLRGTPKFIRDGVKTMARFQYWLFETRDPAKKIREMVHG